MKNEPDSAGESISGTGMLPAWIPGLSPEQAAALTQKELIRKRCEPENSIHENLSYPPDAPAETPAAAGGEALSCAETDENGETGRHSMAGRMEKFKGDFIQNCKKLPETVQSLPAMSVMSYTERRIRDEQCTSAYTHSAF